VQADPQPRRAVLEQLRPVDTRALEVVAEVGRAVVTRQQVPPRPREDEAAARMELAPGAKRPDHTEDPASSERIPSRARKP
jgi:hypothetical protein